MVRYGTPRRDFLMISFKGEIICHIEDSIRLKKDVLKNKVIISQIETLAKLCLDSLTAGGKIIFAGNGGSFADAQHLSAELTSKFLFDRSPIASIVLGANSSAISAISNDYGYKQVFARELTGIANSGDVFIPISTSGKSESILVAVEEANRIGMSVVALTGESGGFLKKICNSICIPSADTARIQECHIMIGHVLCGLIEKNYFQQTE